MSHLSPELINLLDTAAQNPMKRSEIFHQIGQEYLMPLKDRKLQEEVFAIWEYFCSKAEMWVGHLLVPDYYKQNKTKNIPKDIWYTIKEYFLWAVLYNKEIDEYFTQEENGSITVKANPKVRIVSKDTTKDVYKSELGKMKLIPVKYPLDTKIKSGFTLGQKSDILDACIVGLLQEPTHKKESVEKAEKKPVAKKAAKKVAAKKTAK